MLGKELEVIIPNLELVSLIEKKLDQFKEKRGEFLKKHSSTRKYYSKLGYQDSGNDEEKILEESVVENPNEPDLVQIRRDKVNSENIWNDLEMDENLKKSFYFLIQYYFNHTKIE